MDSRIAKAVLFGAAVLPLVGFGCEHHHHHDYVEVDGPVVRSDVVIQDAPPPPQREVVTVAPGPEYIWIGGNYTYDYRAHRYVWSPGRWERRHVGYTVWEPGRWEHRGRGYVWVEGHWR